MRMNDFAGKEFLATVRAEDFAHAGEKESIEMLFKDIQKKPDRQVLDAGCGRGGTADYVQRSGWGEVTGIDVEAQSIERAKQKYPACRFAVCDICHAGENFAQSFDLIYMFNAFYAVRDKDKAMKSLRQCAKNDALLCLFDYVTYDPAAPPPEGILDQMPATPNGYLTLFKEAQWQVERNSNLDDQYVFWYRSFLAKLDDAALKSTYAEEIIEQVRQKYVNLLNCLEKGSMGGVLIFARAV